MAAPPPPALGEGPLSPPPTDRSPFRPVPLPPIPVVAAPSPISVVASPSPVLVAAAPGTGNETPKSKKRKNKEMKADQDGRAKKEKKSNETTVGKTISEEINGQQDLAVENVVKKQKKRKRAVNADTKEVTNQVTMDQTFQMDLNTEKSEYSKRKSGVTSINFQNSREIKAEHREKKKRSVITSPEATTCDSYDAHGLTDQAHVDLMEQEIQHQPFRKDVVVNKSSDTIMTVVSEEKEGKEEPPADTDAKWKRRNRTRRRNKKLLKQNDTVEYHVKENLEVSAQEDCFINTTITPGIEGAKIAVPGKTVCIEYIGKLKDNTVFEDTGYPVRFMLGDGAVMEGWEVGINGMSIGEVRYLMVPPSMGFSFSNTEKLTSWTCHFRQVWGQENWERATELNSPI